MQRDGSLDRKPTSHDDESIVGKPQDQNSQVPPSPSGSVRDFLKQEFSDMAQSERRYRRLFEAARDGILLLDIDTGKITDANPFMYELLGYAPGALLGKELWEIGLFEDRKASQSAFQRLHEVGYIRYEDLPLEAHGGETREVEFVSNVYQEGDQTIIQCNIRDITDRKRVDEALHVALTRELRITAALQHSLTLEISEEAFPGLLIAACYEPALKEAEVGGDFFDIFSLQNGSDGHSRIVMAVGDVIGKGLPAAVLAGRVKEVMRAFLHEDPDPGRTLARLNRYLCDPVGDGGGDSSDEARTILTLAIGVMDVEIGDLAFSCAGAEPPVLLCANGTHEIIEVGGLLLGVVADTTYEVQCLTLDMGDTVLITTDGITEARRALRPEECAGLTDGDISNRLSSSYLLGYEGMLAIAQQHRNLSSVRAMSQSMLKDARAFGGGFRDDVCLLLARRR